MTLVLRWPLELTPSGKFAVAANTAEIWDLRIRSLLCTRKGERAMRTSYGCYFPERLFDKFSPTTPEDDVRMAVSQWLPLLTINKVTIDESWEPAAYNQRDRVLYVNVDYTSPNREQLSSSVAVTEQGQAQ